jgi:hypothetical protein
MFLIHVIEDLHQPIYVGDTGSKGGNLIQVRFFNSRSDLHRVWDSEIIEPFSPDGEEWLGNLNRLAAPGSVAEWAKGTPEDWATETLPTAKEAYCLPGTSTVVKSRTKLGEAYYRMALPMVQTRLAKAGVRIAWVLNEYSGDRDWRHGRKAAGNVCSE